MKVTIVLDLGVSPRLQPPKKEGRKEGREKIDGLLTQNS